MKHIKDTANQKIRMVGTANFSDVQVEGIQIVGDVLTLYIVYVAMCIGLRVSQGICSAWKLYAFSMCTFTWNVFLISLILGVIHSVQVVSSEIMQMQQEDHTHRIDDSVSYDEPPSQADANSAAYGTHEGLDKVYNFVAGLYEAYMQRVRIYITNPHEVCAAASLHPVYLNGYCWFYKAVGVAIRAWQGLVGYITPEALKTLFRYVVRKLACIDYLFAEYNQTQRDRITDRLCNLWLEGLALVIPMSTWLATRCMAPLTFVCKLFYLCYTPSWAGVVNWISSVLGELLAPQYRGWYWRTWWDNNARQPENGGQRMRKKKLDRLNRDAPPVEVVKEPPASTRSENRGRRLWQIARSKIKVTQHMTARTLITETFFDREAPYRESEDSDGSDCEEVVETPPVKTDCQPSIVNTDAFVRNLLSHINTQVEEHCGDDMDRHAVVCGILGCSMMDNMTSETKRTIMDDWVGKQKKTA